jgi:hypothetical protein
LRLSSEHTGFKFEASAKQASKDVARHSGGIAKRSPAAYAYAAGLLDPAVS